MLASVDADAAESDGVALDSGVYRQKISVSGSVSLKKKPPSTTAESQNKGTTKTNLKTTPASVPASGRKQKTSKMDTTRKSPRRASKKVPMNAEHNMDGDSNEEDDDYNNENEDEDNDEEDNDMDVQKKN
ncbi:hypothetical protein ACA910_001362 [Epithemia clementina (nom. ined.)]